MRSRDARRYGLWLLPWSLLTACATTQPQFNSDPTLHDMAGRVVKNVWGAGPPAPRVISLQELQDRMQNRSRLLHPYLERGTLGIDTRGDLVLRTEQGLTVGQRAELRRLMRAENTDRQTLYDEIAKANRHPEWSNHMREIFSLQWRQQAREGWWIQSNPGDWYQK
ncbi:MAG: DUF1318 domain-containing protein [Magnetococcales bacterium]|nr:DUF1318 domain-containing protein [Magnetococcales bacterium]